MLFDDDVCVELSHLPLGLDSAPQGAIPTRLTVSLAVLSLVGGGCTPGLKLGKRL